MPWGNSSMQFGRKVLDIDAGARCEMIGLTKKILADEQGEEMKDV